MLGYKARDFRLLTAVSLDDLVPDDNFYRQLEEHLDLGFIRDLVCELYSEMGRPSIDPVVFFKLQLIAFFEGIRSERRLMDTVTVNLAHRWFIGYDLREEVPDHSSLSKIRDRYGLPTFHRFFERFPGFEFFRFDGESQPAHLPLRLAVRWLTSQEPRHKSPGRSE